MPVMTKDQFLAAIERVSKENITAGRVMAFMIASDHSADPEIRAIMIRAALGISEDELAVAIDDLERYGIGHAVYRN